MTLAIKPLHPLFMAEISGPDLTRPLPTATLAEIEAAMDRYAVAVFPGQDFDDESQIAFASNYGPLDINPVYRARPDDPTFVPHRFKRLEMFDASNLDEHGAILAADDLRRDFRRGNQLWHTDGSFRKRTATYSMLHARVVPKEGGGTLFADTRAAYDALSDTMKTRIEGLLAEHSVWHSRALLGGYAPTPEEFAQRPPVRQPLVRTHPGSGRQALYIAAHASVIVGWPKDEGRALLDELMAHATAARFTYCHQWTSGDLVIWDNRCTMHRGTDFDDLHEVRDLRRTTVNDVVWEKYLNEANL